VALDKALESLAFRGCGDIDELAGGEDLRLQLLAGLEAVIAADLDDVTVRLDAGLFEFPANRLGYLVFFRGFEGDPDGRIPVLFSRPESEHTARTCFQHRHRRRGAVGVEELGHAQLASK